MAGIAGGLLDHYKVFSFSVEWDGKSLEKFEQKNNMICLHFFLGYIRVYFVYNFKCYILFMDYIPDVLQYTLEPILNPIVCTSHLPTPRLHLPYHC